MLAQGAEVAAFEQEFSQELLDGRRAVAVNAGTTGLHLGCSPPVSAPATR